MEQSRWTEQEIANQVVRLLHRINELEAANLELRRALAEAYLTARRDCPTDSAPATPVARAHPLDLN